jgi:hypothetical protein
MRDGMFSMLFVVSNRRRAFRVRNLRSGFALRSTDVFRDVLARREAGRNPPVRCPRFARRVVVHLRVYVSLLYHSYLEKRDGTNHIDGLEREPRALIQETEHRERSSKVAPREHEAIRVVDAP